MFCFLNLRDSKIDGIQMPVSVGTVSIRLALLINTIIVRENLPKG